MVKKQSMRKPYKDRKEFSDNLGPLKRFLKSRCGERWDKVSSEISANIKLTSTVQRHILEHVKDFVSEKILAKSDGTIWANRSWGGFYELFDGYFYVQGGILKQYRKKFKKRKPEPYSDPFNKSLRAAFATEKRLTVFHDREFWRWTRDPKTKAWTVSEVANATHARQDFKMCVSAVQDPMTKQVPNFRTPMLTSLISSYGAFLAINGSQYAAALLELWHKEKRK